jgi:hypothetical protein
MFINDDDVGIAAKKSNRLGSLSETGTKSGDSE